MGVFRRTALATLVTFAFTSAAAAVPNGTPDPAANCVNNATIQFNLEYVQCVGLYPPQATELVGQCQAQAVLKYSQSLAACGNKSASVRTNLSPGLKQNIDSGFTRRLR